MVKVEVQYFHGCPNCEEMLDRVIEAIFALGEQVDFKEVIVETPEKAAEVGFRGSPTLLVNGKDFENMPVPEEPELACRLYANGLPSVKAIKSRIEQYL
jgi:protein-disulfide isomerase